MEDRQKDGRGRDLGCDAAVREMGHGGTEIEDLIQIAGEGRDLVSGSCLLFHKCKIPLPRRPTMGIPIFRPSFRAGVSAVDRVAAATVPG